MKKTSPDTIYVPVPNYVAAAIVPPDATWMHISGQVGFNREGCPEDFESQMAIAMDNILAVLRDADMNAENIVKLTFNIVDRADLEALRKVRDEKLGGVYVASTILVVAGFALPELKVEIDCVAAR